MHVAGIIGYPVASSASPAMHNAAFARLGLDWIYLALAVPPGDGERAIRLLRALDAAGANVTMPHKRTVIEHLDALAPEAATVGAVNTIVREDDRLVGHNTDGAGFMKFLAEIGAKPARALVLGGGGAARGVATALAQAGVEVRVCARDPRQAADIAALADGIEPGAWDEPGEADLVVQATPARVGLPVERLTFRPGVVAVDLIYPLPETPFVAVARGAGAAAYDGLGMLVHQAALSFELWTGAEAPVEDMRRAASSARTR